MEFCEYFEQLTNFNIKANHFHFRFCKSKHIIMNNFYFEKSQTFTFDKLKLINLMVF